MIIKIGANQYVNMDNIECFYIVKKQFPGQDLFEDGRLNISTNTLKIDRGYTMEFIGISGEKYSGTVFKTSAAAMAWWKEIQTEVENE